MGTSTLAGAGMVRGRGLENDGAHNSAVEQTAGSHSLAAAAHRGR